MSDQMKAFDAHRIREAGGPGHCSEQAQKVALMSRRGADGNVSPHTVGDYLASRQKRNAEIAREGSKRPQKRGGR